EPSVEILDHRRAAFHPVAAIDVAQAEIFADDGMVDVSADDSVDAAAPVRLGGQRLLVLSDELHRVLDFQLGPFRQRPIGQAKRAPDRVEIGIDPDRDIVGVAAQEREPARVADDHVEKVAVNDEVAFAAGTDMDGILDHLDAAEMGAVIVAQEFIMIAGDVDQANSFARLSQKFLYDVVVKLRPIPGRLELPAVDDVADEIDGLGFVMAKKVEKLVRLATAGSEMDVRQEQRSNPPRAARHPFKHSLSCAWPLINDFYCKRMTGSGRADCVSAANAALRVVGRRRPPMCPDLTTHQYLNLAPARTGLAEKTDSQAAMWVAGTGSTTKRYLRPRASVAHQQSRSSSRP